MVRNPFAAFRAECARLTKECLQAEGIEIQDNELRLTIPQERENGNLSFSTFAIAKKIGREPRGLAKSIASRGETANRKLVSRVECAGGGYVNFFIDFVAFSRMVIDAIFTFGASYGKSDEKGRKVIVEHTSVNPIHPIHIGGARNAVIGDCLSKLLEASGNEVKRHFYIDDVGLQVAQASYGYGKVAKRKTGLKSDHFIGRIYAGTSCAMNIKRLKGEIDVLKSEGKDGEARERIVELDDWVAAAEDLREKDCGLFDEISGAVLSSRDPDADVNNLLKRYEGKDPEAVKLIRGLSDLALDGFKETLGRVGIGFDSWDWESEVASWSGTAEGVVSELAKTDFVKVEEGTYILDAELTATRFGLKDKYSIKNEIPALTLKRSDGTTLYTTRDIAYTLWKFQRADEVINVISIEQRLPQLQLKIALYALGKGELAEKLVHFSYELVHLPGYKMSGRRGRFVAFDDVLNEAMERAYKEVSKKSPHLGEEERRRISEFVGIGAVRYAMISVASNKPITFTWDRVLNFEQNSAPFIQYAHARASNILAKCPPGASPRPKPDYGSLATRQEQDLVTMLGAFPETVAEASRTLRPEMMAEYSNALASRFNLFYDNVPVLKAEDGGVREAKLRLVEAFKIVLSNALALIGIEAPSRM
jgi:arginyl-tRNA synthetase